MGQGKQSKVNLNGCNVEVFSIKLIEKNLLATQTLQTLTEIDISGNSIRTLPDEISQLTSLRVLRCSKNQFREFPAILLTLHLRFLALDSNYLTRLPTIDPLTQLKELKMLKVDDNLLTTVDTTWMQSPCKINLSLSKNHIADISVFPRRGFMGLESQRVPSKISDGLYLGSGFAALNREGLERLGIRRIITVAKITPAHPNHFNYMVITVEDEVKEDLGAHFERSHSFINQGLGEGGVLIHCAAGVSRSATITIAYLMKEKGWTVDEALHHVKTIRWCVNPNKGFMSQLHTYQRWLQTQREGKEAKRLAQRQKEIETREQQRKTI